MSWSEDPSFIAANQSKLNKPDERHSGGMEWGAYLELLRDEKWQDSMLAFAGGEFNLVRQYMCGRLFLSRFVQERTGTHGWC